MNEHEEERIPLTHSASGSTEGVVLDGWRSTCKCGATWTHPFNRRVEIMDDIFYSHVKYFANKTVVL